MTDTQPPSHGPAGPEIRFHPALIYAAVFAPSVLLDRLLIPEMLPLSAQLFFGGLVMAIGGGLLYYSHITLRKHGLGLMDQIPARRILTDGLYSFTRNPVYAAAIVVYAGAAIACGAVAALVSIAPLVFLLNRLVIVPEETYLRGLFPADFDSYSKYVGRWV